MVFLGECQECRVEVPSLKGGKPGRENLELPLRHKAAFEFQRTAAGAAVPVSRVRGPDGLEMGDGEVFSAWISGL
nr:hypothetical protein Iba_chr09bCG5080 [Ipomoea batatas]